MNDALRFPVEPARIQHEERVFGIQHDSAQNPGLLWLHQMLNHQRSRPLSMFTASPVRLYTMNTLFYRWRIRQRVVDILLQRQVD